MSFAARADARRLLRPRRDRHAGGLRDVRLWAISTLVTGQDIGLFGEQILNGLYDCFVLLAVPLFIVAANIMNASAITDRLFEFCRRWSGGSAAGSRQVDIVVSIIFSGMSGSAIADAAGPGKLMTEMMMPGRPLLAGLRGGGDRGLGDDRADHPALDPDGDVRGRLRHLGRLPVPRRRHPGADHGRRPDGLHGLRRRAARLPGRGDGAAAASIPRRPSAASRRC